MAMRVERDRDNATAPPPSMKKEKTMKKVVPVVGILPIACSRFRGMGKETPTLYENRVQW